MSAQKPASWAYAEGFIPESEVVEAARLHGSELGATPVGPGAGAVLRLLAAAVAARAVIEVGTGGGVSGLWLLQGMPSDGVLTTIDVEAEHQRSARASYAEAGVAHQRTRVITGPALEVLPRMTDGAYDMVVIDADKLEYPAYVEHAIRLLRPGGVLALDNMLWHDRVADPTVRDEETVALRELGKALRDNEQLIGALLPVGDGVFAAVKRAEH
jgi:predicted O-methyltransferase YrrM